MKRLLLIPVLALFVGCGEEKKPAPAEKPAAKILPAATEGDLEILAKADAVGGEADKKVTFCTTCNLSMEANPKHATQFGGYEVHLCSESCKEKFDSGPSAALQKIKFPN